MNLTLSTLPVFVITTETATARHQQINTICNSAGFHDVHYINGALFDKARLSFKQIQKKKSALVAEAHIKALTRVRPPFLILEDDVNLTECFKPVIEVPDDADCLYLGSSTWGYKNGRSMDKLSSGTKISRTLCKVQHMLGMHSIVYLTESYVQSTINNLTRCVSLNQYCDECVAEDMEFHNVYCVTYPYFYQNDGHNHIITAIPVGVYLS